MATVFRFVVEELGYAECRVDAAPVRWHTGLASRLLPALLCFSGVWCIRWFQLQQVVGLSPTLAKALLALGCCLLYLRWLNPLEYESVAVKRTRGVELCTRWKRLEHAVVIPFKDLVAVTIQEVSDRRLLLTFDARGSVQHQAFKQTEPDLFCILEVYGSIAGLLPRQVKKGRVLGLLRDPKKDWAVTRWLGREAYFLYAFAASCRHSAVTRCRRPWHWLLRRYYGFRASELGWLWGAAAAAAAARVWGALCAAAAAAAPLVTWMVSGDMIIDVFAALHAAAAGGSGGAPSGRRSHGSGGGGSGGGSGEYGGSGGGGGSKRPRSRNKGRKH